MSGFDAWLAHNPADYDVQVVTHSEWDADEDYQERFPTGLTLCEICRCGIGGGLDTDDQGQFEEIHILPDERAVCSECADPEPNYPDEDDR